MEGGKEGGSGDRGGGRDVGILFCGSIRQNMYIYINNDTEAEEITQLWSRESYTRSTLGKLQSPIALVVEY